MRKLPAVLAAAALAVTLAAPAVQANHRYDDDRRGYYRHGYHSDHYRYPYRDGRYHQGRYCRHADYYDRGYYNRYCRYGYGYSYPYGHGSRSGSVVRPVNTSVGGIWPAWAGHPTRLPGGRYPFFDHEHHDSGFLLF